MRTGFDIVRLNDEYTAAASHVAAFSTPKPSEGPTMFKREGAYYITAGTGCCACIGGSSVYVLSAPAPAGCAGRCLRAPSFILDYPPFLTILDYS